MLGSVVLALAVAQAPTPDEQPTPPAAPPVEPRHYAAHAGGVLDIGQQPNGLGAAHAGLRVQGKIVRALIEAIITMPTHTLVMGGGAFDTFFVGGDAGVCAVYELFSGCALFRGGGLHSPGGWLPSLSAGARVAIEWPQDTLLAVQASAELRVPLNRLHLLSGGTPVWDQPFINGGGALSLVLRLR